MSKAVLCLSIYAIISTVIIIALSYVIAQELSCQMVTEVTGIDIKERTSSKYDILSVDLSRSKEGQCDVWTSLVMEFFEFFFLEILNIICIQNSQKVLWQRRISTKEERCQIAKRSEKICKT